jgi:hypothetical protein
MVFGQASRPDWNFCEALGHPRTYGPLSLTVISSQMTKLALIIQVWNWECNASLLMGHSQEETR